MIKSYSLHSLLIVILAPHTRIKKKYWEEGKVYWKERKVCWEERKCIGSENDKYLETNFEG